MNKTAGEPDLELKVTVLNVNEGHNEELILRSNRAEVEMTSIFEYNKEEACGIWSAPLTGI